MTQLYYAECIGRMRAAGIPYTTPQAVAKCAKKINSGEAYHASAAYLKCLLGRNPFRQAIPFLLFASERMEIYYRKCAAEAW